tara:strand:+ start:530 stop:838 length:309 start_codon:yes stop_codon:yes gene_type:complete
MAIKYIIKDTILQGYSDSPYSDGIEISDAPPKFDVFTHICKRIDNKWVLEEKDLTEWNAKKYQRDRLAEYPSIQECIHAILDDDLTALQAKRKLIKEKYPKP